MRISDSFSSCPRHRNGANASFSRQSDDGCKNAEMIFTSRQVWLTVNPPVPKKGRLRNESDSGLEKIAILGFVKNEFNNRGWVQWRTRGFWGFLKGVLGSELWEFREMVDGGIRKNLKSISGEVNDD
jgi:hypothetical protein